MQRKSDNKEASQPHSNWRAWPLEGHSPNINLEVPSVGRREEANEDKGCNDRQRDADNTSEIHQIEANCRAWPNEKRERDS